MKTAAPEALRFRIAGGSPLCDDVRLRGFRFFDALADHVRQLPYGRTGMSDDLAAVLREGRGTCSSKHCLLAAVAQQSGQPELQLTVGIYAMCEANTPGVGSVLRSASIASIPEAHCYLRLEDQRLDFTGLASGESSPFESLAAERTVPVSDLAEVKTVWHREVLDGWARAHGLTLEAAWTVREACIAALASAR